MAFELFPSGQFQGPQVDVSLFSDAAKSGVALGSQLPSTITAGVEGYQQGQKIVQGNQQIAENEANIALRQNEVSQIGVNNSIRQTQLENAQTIEEINKLKLDTEQQIHEAELQAEKERLEALKSKYQSESALRSKQNQLQKELENSDPSQQAQLILSGQYDDVFSANPKLYEQKLKDIYINPNNGIDPATRNSIGGVLKVKGLQDSYTDIANKRRPNYEVAEADLFADTITGELMSKTGVSSGQVYDNGRLVPHGTYKTGIDGETIETLPNGRLMENVLSSNVPTTLWDFVWKDPTTGIEKVTSKGVNEKFKQKVDARNREKMIQDGVALRSDIAQVEATFTRESSSNITSPIIGTEAPTNLSLRQQIAKNVLQVPESTVIKIDPILTNLNNLITEEVTTLSGRASPSTQIQKDNLKVTIAQSLANENFDNNPQIQANNTEGDVLKFNKDLEKDAHRRIGFSVMPQLQDRAIQRLIEPFKAKNPKDLYYKKNAEAFNKSVDMLINRYTIYATENSKNKAINSSVTSTLINKYGG